MSQEIQTRAHPSMFDRGFTIVSNSVLDNFNLSKDARLLIIYLTRYATCPNFVAYASTKMKWLDCGRDKLKAVHRELKDHGYIRHVINRGEGGRVLGSYIEFHVEPIFKSSPIPIDDHPRYSSPHRMTENQSPGHQAPGKTSPLINTDPLSNTDLKQTTNKPQAKKPFAANPEQINANKAFVAGLKKGLKKVSNGEFTCEHYDDELIQTLARWDISNAQSSALIAKHGKERMTEVIEMTIRRKADNPAAYVNSLLIKQVPYKKDVNAGKEEEWAAKAQERALEEKKLRTDAEARARALEANRANPERLEKNLGGLWGALGIKKPKKQDIGEKNDVEI